MREIVSVSLFIIQEKIKELKKKFMNPEKKITSCFSGMILILAGIFLAVYAPNLSAESPGDMFQNMEDLPWELRADEVEYDPGSKTYIARKGVTISRGNKKVSADFIRFDRINMRAFAEGNVVMSTGSDTLTGKRIEIDLKDETGVVYQGSIFFRQSHFYIKGGEIRKVGENDYLARKASLTSCDGDSPDWKITAQKLDITVEGYGTLTHGALWVKDIPVFYVPWLIFPVKQKRQSGLLSPEFGNSDRKGLEYSQPLYWAIGENTDATFYYDYMDKRGSKIGGEYRYVLDEKSKGTLMLDFLDDLKTDDGSGDTDNEEWGYDGDAYGRPNSDRYWFRIKADQSLPLGFSSRLDLDIVSDQDYLTEFKSGHAGYDKSKTYFTKYFGRDIDDYNDPIRTSSLTLSQTWDGYSFNAQTIWNDDVTRRRWEETDSTLQELPVITFSASRQTLTGTPLFWQGDSEYTRFYRKDGARGHRADVHPRIFLPLRFGNMLFAEPSLGFQETIWYIDRTDEGDTKEDRNLHREMFDAKLELYTEFFRVYSLENGKSSVPGYSGFLPEKIRHSIRPQISYELVQDQDQEEYPYYDTLDRIEKRNRINFSLVQTLTSRRPKKTPADPDSSSRQNAYDYNRLCRLELGQSYDFYEYDMTEANYDYNSADLTNPEEDSHLSPFFGKIEITPLRWFSLGGDAEWSHRDNRLISHNTALSLHDTRGDVFFAEHRYTKDENESLYMRMNVQMTDALSVYADYEKDMDADEELRQGLGGWYRTQCWSLNLRYAKEQDERSYGFMVNLNGLGGLGSP